MKITMIGKYYIERIPEILGTDVETVIKVVGVSPFSIAAETKHKEYAVHTKDIGQKIDLLKCLRQMISCKENEVFKDLAKGGGKSYPKSNQSDFLIVDNTACVYDLIRPEQGVVYTLARRWSFTDEQLYSLNQEEQKKRRISPYKDIDFNWKHYFDLYIKIILERFPSERILLITGTHNRFYLEKGTLNEYPKDDERKREFLNEIDDYFISKTKCRILDIMDWSLSVRYEKWMLPHGIIEGDTRFKMRDAILELLWKENGIYDRRVKKDFCFEHDLDIDHYLDTVPLTVPNLAIQKFAGGGIQWKIDFLESYQNGEQFFKALEAKTVFGMEDIKQIESYICNRNCRLNDILSIYILYCKWSHSCQFGKIIDLLFESKSVVNFSEKLAEKNKKILLAYGYISNEIINNLPAITNTVQFLKLTAEYYLKISKVRGTMEICRLHEDVDKNTFVELSYHCSMNHIVSVLSSYSIYIEKARRNEGKLPFIVDVTYNELTESLAWMDYSFLLKNENILFHIKDIEESQKFECTCRVNFDFLFNESIRLVRIGDGLGDQLFLYMFAKTLEKATGCTVFLMIQYILTEGYLMDMKPENLFMRILEAD